MTTARTMACALLAAALALVGPAATPAGAASGDIDTTWSDDGVATITTPYSTSSAPLASGRLYVGSRRDGDGGRMRIIRFDPDGTLDADYGVGGVHKRSFAGDSTGTSWPDLLLAPNPSQLTVVGELQSKAGRARLGIARLDADGAYDRSFSGDGRVAYRIFKREHDFVQPFDAEVLTNGDLMVAVSAFDWVGDETAYVGQAVVRINVDGTLDPRFSGDGILIPPDDWTDFAFTSGGAVYAGRTVGPDHQIRRINSAGRPDMSFDGNGVASVPCPADYGVVITVAPPEQGPMLSCISTPGSGDEQQIRYTFARLTFAGQPDDRWGGDGRTSLVLPDPGGTRWWFMSVPRDSIPWVLAQSSDGDGMEIRTYGQDGAPNPQFSGDGLDELILPIPVPYLDGAKTGAGRLYLEVPRGTQQMSIVAIEGVPEPLLGSVDQGVGRVVGEPGGGAALAAQHAAPQR